MFPKFSNEEALIRLFEGAENEPKRAPWRRHDRTQAVVALTKCLEYDEAKKWLERIGEEGMDPRVLESWGVEQDWLRAKVELFTGSHGEALRRAEEGVLYFRSGEAVKVYKSVLDAEGDSLSPSMRDFLKHELKVVRIEHEMSSKGKVSDFGPDDDGGGWLMEYAAGYDGDVTASGVDARYFRATCQAKIGPEFVLKGTVKTENAEAGLRAWVSFGYPEWTYKERWSAVSFARKDDSGAVILTNAMNSPEEFDELELADSFSFRLSVSRGGISLWVDDDLVWDDVPVPRGYVKEGHSRLGFGGIFSSPRVGVQFSDLQLSGG